MFEEIREIIADQIGIDAGEIKETSSFKEDLGIDSLDLFEIVMQLEEKYDVEIDSNELEDVKTIKDVIEFLNKKIA